MLKMSSSTKTFKVLTPIKSKFYVSTANESSESDSESSPEKEQPQQFNRRLDFFKDLASKPSIAKPPVPTPRKKQCLPKDQQHSKVAFQEENKDEKLQIEAESVTPEHLHSLLQALTTSVQLSDGARRLSQI